MLNTITVADTINSDIETRSHYSGPWLPSDPEVVRAWLVDPEGADPELTDPLDAMTISAFWRATTLIGELMGNLPKHVVETLDDDSFRRVTHPVGKLFRDQSSPYVPAESWIESAIMHAMLFGWHVSEIEWSGGSQAMALHPLDPRYVVAEFYRDGDGRDRHRYKYTPPNGGTTRLDPADVFVIRGPSFSDVHPTSRVWLARRTLGVALLGEQLGGRFLANGAVPSIVVETQHQLSAEAEGQLDRMMKARQGVRNAGKAMQFPPGVSAKAIGVDAQKAQLLETREHQIREVSRVTGVPAFLLGDMAAATYNNGEQLGRQFVDYTLLTWARRFEAEARIKLLPAGLKLQFNFDALLRADTLERLQAYQIGRSISLYDVDEIRALENRAPLPDGLGKQRLYPLNMGVVGKEKPAPTPAPAPAPPTDPEAEETEPVETRDLSPSKFLRPFVRDVVARFTARHAKALQAAADKLAKSNDVREFAAWADSYAANTQSVLALALQPVVEAGSSIFAEFPADHAATRAQTLADELRQTLATVRTAADVPAILDELQTTIDQRTDAELALITAEG